MTHHIIAEKKLGRPLRAGERARFKDKNRQNLDPNNIEVISAKTSSFRRKRAQLVARIEELQGQLAELDREEREHLKSNAQ